MANIPFLNNAYFSAKVGIGTDSPDGVLEVVTTDANRYVRFKAPNGEERFQFYTGGTGNASRLDMYNSDGTTRNVQISAGGNSYFNAGNVGIGTTSPNNSLLEIGVSGTLGSVTNKVISTIIDGGYSTLNSLQYNVNAFIGTTYGTSDIFAQTSSEVLKNFYTGLIAPNSYFNNARYSVVQGGAERLTVAQGGNVGIGTTDPSTKLEVAGITTIKSPKAYGSEEAVLRIGVTSSGTNYSDGTFHNIVFGNESVANSHLGEIQVVQGDASVSTASDMRFFTNSGGGNTATNEAMRITSAGNVGIGTTSPSTKLMLEHYNDGAVGGTIRIKDRDTQQSANQLTGAIEFESQDATTPTSGVSTAIKAFAASSTGGSYLTISTTDVSTSTLDERMRIDSDGTIRFNDYGAGTLVTDASGNITVSSGGGAGGPYLPLAGGTVTGNLTTNGVFTIQNAAPYIQWTNVAGTRLGYIQHNATNLIVSADTGQIQLDTAANNDILINPGGTGNVGIGTTSPLYKLQVQDRIHIEDTATQQPKISFSENTNSSGEFVLEYNGVGGGAGNYVSFYSEVTGWITKGNGLNYIPQNGRVGIGTASPATKLQVAGGIQMADDTDTASAAKVGTLKYRVSGNNSYVDMCMQTGATTYAWINIVQNNW